MKGKPKQPIRKSTQRLATNHSWTAPKGYKVVAIERGAVIFNIPQDWTLTKLQPIEIYDKEPPADNARISVSFWRLPPGLDWTELPLEGLLNDATKDLGKSDERQILDNGPVKTSPRTDLELATKIQRFVDPLEHREAYTYMATARGWDVHVLITFDFWLDDLAKCAPVWDEVLRSLQLGLVIDDPTKGIMRH
ncbi:MAG TPA: hypothetical protein VKQ72_21465 [Aggregatilineales bacterium]|nr:hypothetical protein [Aggregatilineales bacterium]